MLATRCCFAQKAVSRPGHLHLHLHLPSQKILTLLQGYWCSKLPVAPSGAAQTTVHASGRGPRLDCLPCDRGTNRAGLQQHLAVLHRNQYTHQADRLQILACIGKCETDNRPLALNTNEQQNRAQCKITHVLHGRVASLEPFQQFEKPWDICALLQSCSCVLLGWTVSGAFWKTN